MTGPHDIVAAPSPFDAMLARDAGAKRRWQVSSSFALKLVLPVSILIVWEAVARSGLVPSYNFPPPSAVLGTLFELARNGVMFTHLSVSALRVLCGFLIGAGAGTVLGALTGFSTRWHDLLDGTVQSLRSIPIIAWVPLFILWLGIDATCRKSSAPPPRPARAFPRPGYRRSSRNSERPCRRPEWAGCAAWL
jgi:hypothetical protein